MFLRRGFGPLRSAIGEFGNCGEASGLSATLGVMSACSTGGLFAAGRAIRFECSVNLTHRSPARGLALASVLLNPERTVDHPSYSFVTASLHARWPLRLQYAGLYRTDSCCVATVTRSCSALRIRSSASEIGAAERINRKWYYRPRDCRMCLFFACHHAPAILD